MSIRLNGIPIISAQEDMICFECGSIAETRPYGKDGAEICHACGMKDERQTMVNMYVRLFGESTEEANRLAASWMLNHKESA